MKDLVNMEFASHLNNKDHLVDLMVIVHLDFGVPQTNVNQLSPQEVLAQQQIVWLQNVDTKRIVLTQNVSLFSRSQLEQIQQFQQIKFEMLQTIYVNQDGQMQQVDQHTFV